MAVLKITKENFNEEVLKNEKAVLIDFYATWCGPCRMVAPVIDEIAEERTDIVVGKVNVDEEEELARAFGVTNIPMIAVVKDGILKNATVGAKPKEEILQMLD